MGCRYYNNNIKKCNQTKTGLIGYKDFAAERKIWDNFLSINNSNLIVLDRYIVSNCNQNQRLSLIEKEFMKNEIDETHYEILNYTSRIGELCPNNETPQAFWTVKDMMPLCLIWVWLPRTLSRSIFS